GGTGPDLNSKVAIDSSGNAYVTGTTASPDFPTTLGAYQTKFGGGDADAFVSKLDASGSALIYSTFLGGGGSSTRRDEAHWIAVDGSGSVYVAGSTTSSNFPITPG